MEDEKKSLEQLIGIIRDYLDTYVTKPAVGTIKEDIYGINKLGSILIALQYSSDLIKKNGIGFDKSFLKRLSLDENEKRIKILSDFIDSSADHPEVDREEVFKIFKTDNSEKHLIPFLQRELNWITISILSASYLSAQVLLRSSFELLIGIATKVTGLMNERISSIDFLLPGDLKIIKKLWRNLCGWGHPYKKWEKEVCAIYYSHNPIYHPKYFNDCLDKLKILIGFFMITALHKYEVSDSELMEKLNQSRIDFSEFPLLDKRVNPNKICTTNC